MRRKESIRRTIIVLTVIAILATTGIRNSQEYVHHPNNQPFKLEVAFNECLDMEDVTQKQFYERYLK